VSRHASPPCRRLELDKMVILDPAGDAIHLVDLTPAYAHDLDPALQRNPSFEAFTIVRWYQEKTTQTLARDKGSIGEAIEAIAANVEGRGVCGFAAILSKKPQRPPQVHSSSSATFG
jgi:hypothetical protein